MGIIEFNIFKKKDTIKPLSHASVYVPSNYNTIINESLKGIVEVEKPIFPKDLGEPHPFDFKMCEDLVKKYGILSAIVDKHIDFIMSGGISCQGDDDRAVQIINDFMYDFNFDCLLRNWLREAFIKGNGFLEMGFDNNKSVSDMRVLNANHIYINRDDSGKITGYKQYLKDMKLYNQNAKDTVLFRYDEIAQLSLYKYGDMAYGLGIVNPIMVLINDLIGSRKEMMSMFKRKANNPYVFIGGNRDKDEFPSQAEMDDLGQKLEWLNNKHEWVLSDYWKVSTLDFGKLADKFDFVIEHNLQMLFMACQIPEVIMGKGNIAEGLAQEQMKAFMYRINSLREECEKVIVDQIFKVVLKANGFEGEKVEIVWGVPSDEDKLKRVNTLTFLLQNPLLNQTFRNEIESELADLLDIDYQPPTNSELERQGFEEQPQPSIPGKAKLPNISQKKMTLPRIRPDSGLDKEPLGKPVSPRRNSESVYNNICESIDDSITVQEWVGFNYQTFVQKIVSFLTNYHFNDLRATTKTEIEAGLLKTSELITLRNKLIDGFQKNKSIRQISSDLQNSITWKDRLKLDEKGMIVYNENKEPVVQISADKRPSVIARTETIRAANQGNLKNYIDNGIEKVKWVAAESERTCEECSNLDGHVFVIEDCPDIPLHSNCRCSYAPVVFEKVDKYE